MVTEIIVLILLIMLNAFFAAAEIALVSLNDNKLKMMAEAGDHKSKKLYKFLAEPSRFLATIQIGITLAGFMASAFAADRFSERLATILFDWGVSIPRELLETVSMIIITLLLSYFTLVFGELVPKRLALLKAESISRVSVTPLTILSSVSSPFVKLLTFSTNFVIRILGINPEEEEENVTEEEIRMMLDVGNELGTIEKDEKEMINNVFEFNNKIVSEIMTHRLKIAAIPIDSTFSEVVSLVNREKYTRYPVYEKDIDRIIGILHGKDLIQYLETENSPFHIRKMIRPAYFVIESKRIDILFKEMQKNKVHMAIVLDEYGGTDGIVTIEDLVEEIVGNIYDEYDVSYVEDEILV